MCMRREIIFVFVYDIKTFLGYIKASGLCPRASYSFSCFDIMVKHWVLKLPCWNLYHPSPWHDPQRSDPSHLANACCKQCQDSHPRSSHNTVLWLKQLRQDPTLTPACLYHRQY